MFLDLNKVSIEEVVGRLRVFEERSKPKEVTDAMGRLMLCEEDWESRRKSYREQENSWRRSGSGGRDKRRGCGRGRGSSGSDGQNMATRHAGGKLPPGDRCNSCGKTGHWAKDCRGKKKGVAHVTHAKEDEHALMYIAAETEVTAPHMLCSHPRPLPPAAEPQAYVHLVERKVLLHLSKEKEEVMGPRRWVLDTGATNHMTGTRAVFAKLNTSVTGTVKFGDGSMVDIKGKGTVLFACKSGEHHRLDGVYYIPRLTTNIMSLGQMDEDGFKVDIESGILRLYDLQ
jgi:hypothetical protein